MPNAVADLYVATWAFVWSRPRVPAPQEIADWIEARSWGDIDGEWLESMVARLRAWPADKPFPLIPDDDALMNGECPVAYRYRGGWWRAGTPSGDLIVSIRPR